GLPASVGNDRRFEAAEGPLHALDRDRRPAEGRERLNVHDLRLARACAGAAAGHGHEELVPHADDARPVVVARKLVRPGRALALYAPAIGTAPAAAAWRVGRPKPSPLEADRCTSAAR